MLVSRMTEQYKKSKQNPVPLIVQNSSFNNITKEYKYIRQASFQTARAMHLAEQQRLIFDEQKNLIGIATLADPVLKDENEDYVFKIKTDM